MSDAQVRAAGGISFRTQLVVTKLQNYLLLPLPAASTNRVWVLLVAPAQNSIYNISIREKIAIERQA